VLTVKQLKDWLSQFPDNAPIEGEYFVTHNSIDLKVVLHLSDGEPDCISTIGIE
jgi:hypothetical protein